MNYARTKYTEAQLSESDDRAAHRPTDRSDTPAYRYPAPSGRTLPELERDTPALAEQLLKVRGLRTRERWAEIATRYEVASEEEQRLIKTIVREMPGECCLADAARLIARK